MRIERLARGLGHPFILEKTGGPVLREACGGFAPRVPVDTRERLQVIGNVFMTRRAGSGNLHCCSGGSLSLHIWNIHSLSVESPSSSMCALPCSGISLHARGGTGGHSLQSVSASENDGESLVTARAPRKTTQAATASAHTNLAARTRPSPRASSRLPSRGWFPSGSPLLALTVRGFPRRGADKARSVTVVVYSVALHDVQRSCTNVPCQHRAEETRAP